MMNNLQYSIQGMITRFIPPLHPSGWPYVVGCAFAAIILSLIWDFAGVIALIISLWCFYFFRQPKRVTPQRDGLIIAPAAGTVTHITKDVPLPSLFDEPTNQGDHFTRITITPNIFDVHINRIPIQGTVTQKSIQQQAVIDDTFDKTTEDITQTGIIIQATYKNKTYDIGVVQQGSLAAKKVICDAKKGDDYDAGAAYGFTQFHAQIDLYLPKGVSPLVAIGQTMIDGETVMADLSSKEKQRPAFLKD